MTDKENGMDGNYWQKDPCRHGCGRTVFIATCGPTCSYVECPDPTTPWDDGHVRGPFQPCPLCGNGAHIWESEKDKMLDFLESVGRPAVTVNDHDGLRQQIAAVLLRDYESEYQADHLTPDDFAGQADSVLSVVLPFIAQQVSAAYQKGLDDAVEALGKQEQLWWEGPEAGWVIRSEDAFLAVAAVRAKGVTP